MNRSNLILSLSEKNSVLTESDIKKCVEIILRAIGEGLADGCRTEIRGFGTFSRRTRRPRIGRNPKTGESVNIAGKAALHFKVSNDILNVINSVEKQFQELGV